jgi:hypothetical protein
MFKKQVTIPFIVFLCWYQLSLAMDQRQVNGDEKSKNQVIEEAKAALLRIRVSLVLAKDGAKGKNPVVNPKAPMREDLDDIEVSDPEDDLSRQEEIQARALTELSLPTPTHATAKDQTLPTRSASVQIGRRG